MRLLVFGATGQLARELAGALPEEWHAEFLDRSRADLTDPGACAARVAMSGADAVINTAAFTAVDRAEQDEELAHIINGAAPAAIAGAAAARGVPFIHTSTDYVFDGAGDAPYEPEHPVAPLSAYGRSKLAGEEGVRAAGGVHVILRTSWVFSAHGSNFVREMLRLGAGRGRLRVVADQIGGPTPARALARACLVIAESLARAPGKSGTYHFAGAPDVSRADLARTIMALARMECEIDDILTSEWSAAAPRPLNSRLDCRSTEAAFGLVRPDWREGLAAVLRELDANSG